MGVKFWYDVTFTVLKFPKYAPIYKQHFFSTQPDVWASNWASSVV